MLENPHLTSKNVLMSAKRDIMEERSVYSSLSSPLSVYSDQITWMRYQIYINICHEYDCVSFRLFIT